MRVPLGRKDLARIASLLAVVGMALIGCGKTEYESRMDGALAASTKRGGGGGGANDPLLSKDYVAIADSSGRSTGVKFKLPVSFASAMRLTPDVPAAKIPQADIPGLSYTLQITLADNASKQYPAYCHIYAVPKASTQLDALKDTIKQGLAAVEAKDFTVGTVGGVPTGLPIHYMNVKGDMDFEVAGAIEKTRGTIGVFIVEGPNDYAIVGWRYEKNSAETNKLLDGVSSSMVSFIPEAGAPAPAMP